MDSYELLTLGLHKGRQIDPYLSFKQRLDSEVTSAEVILPHPQSFSWAHISRDLLFCAYVTCRAS